MASEARRCRHGIPLFAHEAENPCPCDRFAPAPASPPEREADPAEAVCGAPGCSTVIRGVPPLPRLCLTHSRTTPALEGACLVFEDGWCLAKLPCPLHSAPEKGARGCYDCHDNLAIKNAAVRARDAALERAEAAERERDEALEAAHSEASLRRDALDALSALREGVRGLAEGWEATLATLERSSALVGTTPEAEGGTGRLRADLAALRALLGGGDAEKENGHA